MVVFGNYTSYLNETFFVEKGKAYDTEDPISGPVVREMLKRHPDAFGGSPAPTPPPPVPVVEQATAAPGETRKRAPKSNG